MKTTYLPRDIELWDVELLKPNPENARKHSEEQIDELAACMAAFGFMSAVVACSDGRVLAGNARLLAAHRLGLRRVPVIPVDHLTESEKKAFAIADNQIALRASWDDSLLRVQLELLRQEGMDLKLAGFSDAEFSRLVDKLEAAIEREDQDTAPQLTEIAITEPGDLWMLGEHLLICGDSTIETTYQQLLDGGMADMVFTDLPYNCAYRAPLAADGSVRHAPITNDDLGAEFGAFLEAACRLMIAYANGAMYICMSSAELHALYQAFTVAGGHWSTFLIWFKQTFTLGHSDYQRQFEPILYGWPKAKQHYWCGDRNQGDVWQIDRMHSNDLHPTMKPIELVERAIRNSSKRGDIVLDPFAGSGTTLIASEKTGRRARVAELESRYCDVIIKRWQRDFPDRPAIHRGTGLSFDQRSVERLIEPAEATQ